MLVEATNGLLLGYLALSLVARYGVDLLIHVIYVNFHDLFRVNYRRDIPSTRLTSRLRHIMQRYVMGYLC